MLLRNKPAFSYLHLIVFVVVLFSCKNTENKQNQKYHQLTGEAQGTIYSVKYEAPDNVFLGDSVKRLLNDFDLIFSTYKDNSLITKLNNNDTTLQLTQQFIYLFNVAKDISGKTEGAFDMTIGPVAKAWGFDYAPKTDMIDSTLIDSLLQYVGMDKVWIENNRLYKKYPQTTLNVNAIAQGYSVDIVAEFLESKNIKNYMVEIGGELRTSGVNDKGAAWNIGVDKPGEENTGYGDRELQNIISLSGKSLATSGNYRKFWEENGIKYSHTLNPATGYPVSSKLLSATIICEKCIEADALATACMVMGLEKSRELMNTFESIDAYFIFSDENGKLKTEYTPNLKNIIK